MLRQAAAHIDTVRLGWGSAYVTADLQAKLAAYRAHDVPVMLGGTLTELAWLHGRVDELCAWLDELAIDRIEVSSGVVAIPPEEKTALIERLAARYTVYAEVGEKDPAALLAPYRWVQLIRDALAGGRRDGRLRGPRDRHRRPLPPRRRGPHGPHRRDRPRDRSRQAHLRGARASTSRCGSSSATAPT